MTEQSNEVQSIRAERLALFASMPLEARIERLERAVEELDEAASSHLLKHMRGEL